MYVIMAALTLAMAGPPAAVVNVDSAERRVAPNGAATATVLGRGENAFVARLEMAPGAKVGEHQDVSEEYIVVLSGGGTLIMDGIEHQLTVGSAVFMPANATVSYVNGPDPMVALQVFADAQSAAKYDSWTVATP